VAFKQDEDFLRFITMGASGSATVARYLTGTEGHRMVELERYAMANKIWATKIKRLRLLDLVCLDCGLRVEARAKSKLAIRMSDSEAPGRAWDGPMRDEDICAFVPWDAGSATPAERPECFTVGAMRAARKHAKLGPRKSASEGAERDLEWPTCVPTLDGAVTDIDYATGKVKVLTSANRCQSYSLRGQVPSFIYVEKGQKYDGREIFLVGSVEPVRSLRCPGPSWDYAQDLYAVSELDRYVAIKVAGAFADPASEVRLVEIAEDDSEDDRVRLEAWASLAKIDPGRYTSRVLDTARARTTGERHAMAMAMEATFVLSELRTKEAASALADLARDTRLDPEARCAAVWGLGVAGANRADLVLGYIADGDDEVALHALAGVGRLPLVLLAQVEAMLSGTPREAASAAALLAQQGTPGIRCLVDAATRSGPGATPAAGALGDLTPEQVRGAVGGKLPRNLEGRLAPMWSQRQSWLRARQLATPLQFLERQTIRHLP
jgi:hypothetical protein